MPFNVDKHDYSAIAGETLSEDEAVAIHSDGTAWLASAGSGVEDMPGVGIVASGEVDVEAGERVSIRTSGSIKPAPNSLTVGAVYLSDTPGALSNSEGNTSQIMGYVFLGSDGVEELMIAPELCADNHPAES